MEKLKGALRMTDLADMILEDRLIEIAQKMLKRGISTDAVAEDTGP
jgi:hypothetical protein